MKKIFFSSAPFPLRDQASADLTTWHNLLDHIIPLSKFNQNAKSRSRQISNSSTDTIIPDDMSDTDHEDSEINPEDIDRTLMFLKMFIKGEYSSYNSFKEQSKCYFDKKSCGKVWGSNQVAFRCKTCWFTPCMSICADCFFNGDHRDHDYMVFISDSGGACDCGLDTVMKSSGFCKKHKNQEKGIKVNNNFEPRAPEIFTIFLKHTVPRILQKILHNIRLWWEDDMTNNQEGRSLNMNDRNRERCKPIFRIHKSAASEGIDDPKTDSETTRLIAFLSDLVELGGDVRRIVADILLDENMIDMPCEEDLEMIEKTNSKQFYLNKYVYNNGNRNLFTDSKSAQKSFLTGIKNIYRECPQICPKFTSLFDEFFAWLITCHCPMEMVMFFLNLLPVNNFKLKFAETLVKYYPVIWHIIGQTHDKNRVSRMNEKVIHMSVQVFCNENVINYLLDSGSHLLSVFDTSLRILAKGEITAPGHDHDEGMDLQAVSWTDSLMANNKLWILGTDLTNILQHEKARQKFVQDKLVFHNWIKFVSKFNKAFCIKRRTINDGHVGDDNQYQKLNHLFIMSRDTLYQPLSYFLDVLKPEIYEDGEEELELSAVILEDCLEIINDVLLEWIDRFYSDISNYDIYNGNIPLHRYFAAFIAYGLNHHLIELEDYMMCLSTSQLDALIINPLLIQIQSREIRNSLWLRNGSSLVLSANRFYSILPLCTWTADLDIFLVQCCLTSFPNPGDYLIYKTFQFKNDFSLRIRNTLSDAEGHDFSQFDFEDNPQLQQIDEVDKQRNNNMVIDSLNLIATILSYPRNIFTFSELDMMKLEIITALAMRKESFMTYSQLLANIPKANEYEIALCDHKKYVELFKEALPLVTEQFKGNLLAWVTLSSVSRHAIARKNEKIERSRTHQMYIIAE